MSLNTFLEKIHHNNPVSFTETIAVITDNYHYHATEFSNGLILNLAGTNEGSCKIFAFASIHQLSALQTLNLFGDYYRIEVLTDPNGSGHQNIRSFMQNGWQGIVFKGDALTVKE
jgi:hypothetical protein